MTDKINLSSAGSGYNLTVINDNFAKIEEALNERVLYRDAAIDETNSVLSDIDINGKRLYNLSEPIDLDEAARLRDVQSAISGATAANLITASDGAGGSLFTTVQGFITKAISSIGSSLIGFIHSGVGATQRTIQDRLREKISIKDYGAVGDGVTDDTAAFNAALAHAQSTSTGTPSIYFPPGKYVINTIALDSLRGVDFYGDSALDPVATFGKTWIYWKSASAAAALLSIKSCAYLNFKNISFYSNGNTGKNSMVAFSCNQSSVVPPLNKFASTKITFENCSFLITTGSPMTVATIDQKSTLGITYNNCIIYGTNAIKLGADTEVGTIPDGRAVLTKFSQTSFRGNVIRERVLGARWENCYFSENSEEFAPSSLRVAFLSCSGAQEVRNEHFVSCVTDTANATHNAAVWYQGPNNGAGIGGSVTFINNQLAGAGTMIDLNSGVATIHNNKFIAQNLPGVTTFRAVRINDGTKKWSIDGNDYDGLMSLNTTSVVSTAVLDNRTTFEDAKYILARGRATDLTLANNNFTQILSRTLTQVEGGLYEVSYTITVSSAIDSLFTARLLLDGVAIPGCGVQMNTNTTAAKTFTLTLSPRIVKLAATDLTATRVIELQIQQVSGATFATVRGDATAAANTFIRVKNIT